jgi:lipoprotein NlpD
MMIKRFFYLPIFLFALMMGGCGTAKIDAPVRDLATPPTTEAAPEPQVNRPQVYIVQRRDTLHKIALDFGLDHRELALWNALANPEFITVGQTLRLSPPKNAPRVATVAKQKIPAAPPSPAPSPQSTLIGGANKASLEEPPLPPDVIVKNAPLAEKYPYSKSAAKKLRRGEKKSKQQPQTAAPASSQSAAIGAPQQTRRRFGVVWSWPASGKVIGKFSERSKGLDIGGASGAPVYAGADGKIVYVGAGVQSYGRLIVIKHANDYLSAYAHNRRTLVAEGDPVVRGQKIAEMGDTGDAQQVKLHFEIRKTGKPIDPMLVLPQKP